MGRSSVAKALVQHLKTSHNPHFLPISINVGRYEMGNAIFSDYKAH
jgi:hypothetical protein